MRNLLVVVSLFAAAAPAARAAVLDVKGMLEERKNVVIGINVGEVGDALAAQLGVDSDNAILVADVNPEMPAAKAGLKRFDVIVGVDGHALEDRNGLRGALAKKHPGDTVSLTIMRDGKKREIEVGVVEAAAPANMLGSLLERQTKETGARDALASQLLKAPPSEQGAVAEHLKQYAEQQAKHAQEYGQVVRERLGAADADARKAYEAALASSMDRVAEAKRAVEDARRSAVEHLQQQLAETQASAELNQTQKAYVEKAMQQAQETMKKSLADASRRLDSYRRFEMAPGQDGKWRALFRQDQGRDGADGQNERGAWRRSEGGGADLSGVEKRLGAIEERLARIEKLLEARSQKKFD